MDSVQAKSKNVYILELPGNFPVGSKQDLDNGKEIHFTPSGQAVAMLARLEVQNQRYLSLIVSAVCFVVARALVHYAKLPQGVPYRAVKRVAAGIGLAVSGIFGLAFTINFFHSFKKSYYNMYRDKILDDQELLLCPVKKQGAGNQNNQQ